MHGWTGRILAIDLSTESFAVETPAPEIYSRLIGGRGLAGHYMGRKITLPWNDPEMPLLFFTGPLTNTLSPGSAFVNVMSRSPLTGTVGDFCAGGRFGVETKRAGWDGIIITGKCATLKGVNIADNQIEFADASRCAGMTTTQLAETLDLKNACASIGPAAENGVMFANIAFDGHSCAGRNGLGMIMAEKNLKYVTVAGSAETEIYDMTALSEALEKIMRLTAASPALMGEPGFTNYGTGALYDLVHARCMMPTNNFKSTFFIDAPQMNAWNYKQKYRTKKSECPACHIQCKFVTADNRTIPEFEAMAHFSALIGNADMETVIEANRMCDEYGMDPVSAAGALACYAEINELTFKPQQILDMLKDIATSHGVGVALKKGSAAYAVEMKQPELAMTVKGMEIPGYDPRGAYGTALGYAVSTRGACHLSAYPISHEILRKPVATDRFTFEGKARAVKIGEDTNAAADSLIACKLMLCAASLEEFADALHGATGIKTSAHELLATGSEICLNERRMNSANGFSSDDDDLPERFFKENGSEIDGIETKRIDRQAFLKARENYYKIRGLDRNGRPASKILD